MFTKETERDFMLAYLNKSDTLFEWGSGSSTKLLAKRVKEVYSVEHDKEWFDKARKSLPKNAHLSFVGVNKPFSSKSKKDGSLEQFRSYVKHPLKLDRRFDVVFIDGRARVECVKMVRNICHQDSLIFVHDFVSRLETDNYKVMLGYLDLIDVQDDMALFKIRG